MDELEGLRATLARLKQEGKIRMAYLFGSLAKGEGHRRSDIDLAIYVRAETEAEGIEIVDAILGSADRPVELLRLDDEDESPLVVQQALRGVPLVEPDRNTYYEVAHRALHEAEAVFSRRAGTAA